MLRINLEQFEREFFLYFILFFYINFACLHCGKQWLGYISPLVFLLKATFNHLPIIVEFREAGGESIDLELYYL